MKPVEGDQKDLQICDIAQDDRWVARDEFGQVYFVRGPCIPGERVRAEIAAVKKSFIEAERIEVLEPSSDRVSSPCPFFGKCGGCQIQHIRYNGQLRIKKKMICDALQRLGRFNNAPVEEVIPSEEEYLNRNKIELVFTPEGHLAFHSTGLEKILVTVNRCLLIPDILNRLLDATVRFFTVMPLADRQACGLQRLTLRRSAMDGRVMVVIQTNRMESGSMQNYAEHILAVSGPDRTTVVAVTGDSQTVLCGSGVLEEKLGAYKFMIASDSFFQTCTRQAEKLCETVVEMSQGGRQDLALDLFCGTGPITHYLSAGFSEVIGLDGEKSAIENATANALLNGCSNIRFQKKSLDRMAGIRDMGCPDLVVMDPPRNGIHADALKSIVNLGAERMIYVSCNPATFARDARLICENSSYRLVRVQPIDMFPQTSHVETVSLFIK